MSEPKLMPFQDLPFNGDTFITNEFLKLRDEYQLTTAIETGSCLYSTTHFLGLNFSKVYSVEINENFAKYGIHKVKHLPHVKTYIDDSILWMKTLVTSVLQPEDRCIFFLDAHWGDVCPLLFELKEISNIKTTLPPIISIHDFYTGNPELGYDKYKGQPFTWDWIKPNIEIIEKKLGCKYDFYFNEKAIGAKRGIIYITPKI